MDAHAMAQEWTEQRSIFHSRLFGRCVRPPLQACTHDHSSLCPVCPASSPCRKPTSRCFFTTLIWYRPLHSPCRSFLGNPQLYTLMCRQPLRSSQQRSSSVAALETAPRATRASHSPRLYCLRAQPGETCVCASRGTPRSLGQLPALPLHALMLFVSGASCQHRACISSGTAWHAPTQLAWADWHGVPLGVSEAGQLSPQLPACRRGEPGTYCQAFRGDQRLCVICMAAVPGECPPPEVTAGPEQPLLVCLEACKLLYKLLYGFSAWQMPDPSGRVRAMALHGKASPRCTAAIAGGAQGRRRPVLQCGLRDAVRCARWRGWAAQGAVSLGARHMPAVPLQLPLPGGAPEVCISAVVISAAACSLSAPTYSLLCPLISASPCQPLRDTLSIPALSHGTDKPATC